MSIGQKGHTRTRADTAFCARSWSSKDSDQRKAWRNGFQRPRAWRIKWRPQKSGLKQSCGFRWMWY